MLCTKFLVSDHVKNRFLQGKSPARYAKWKNTADQGGGWSTFVLPVASVSVTAHLNHYLAVS